MNSWQTVAIAVFIALVNIVGAIVKHRAKQKELERRRQRAAPLPTGAGPGAARPPTSAPSPMQRERPIVTAADRPAQRPDQASPTRGEVPTSLLSNPLDRGAQQSGPAPGPMTGPANRPPVRSAQPGSPGTTPRLDRRDPRLILLQEMAAATSQAARPSRPVPAAPPAAMTTTPTGRSERAFASTGSIHLKRLGRQELRRAVLLAELLAPPIAMRDGSPVI